MIQKQYQILGSDFLASRKNAILADEMGLGKTGQAVCAIDLLGLHKRVDKVLIICPAICRPQWDAQLEHWLMFHNQFPVQQVEKTSDKITGNTIMVSYNLVNDLNIWVQLTAIDWDVIIYDEFHYMKSVEAKRTTAILGKGGIITKSKHNWFLSGTPVNRPADLFPVLCTIARSKLKPYDRWEIYASQFCGAYKDDFGHLKTHGNSNEEQLADMLSKVMLRRLACDVEPDLGEPILDPVILELPDDVQDVYEREVDDIDIVEYTSTQKRSILANLKGGTIYEHMKLVLHNEKKLVVFYHHKAICKYLMGRMAGAAFKIDGSVPVKKRTGIINKFNKSKNAVLFGQSDAVGTGTDGLQHGAGTCYFAEIPWNPDVRDQNIRRLLRPGQKDKVKAILPRLRGTVDDHIVMSNYQKEQVINKILKGKKNVKDYFN